LSGRKSISAGDFFRSIAIRHLTGAPAVLHSQTPSEMVIRVGPSRGGPAGLPPVTSSTTVHSPSTVGGLDGRSLRAGAASGGARPEKRVVFTMRPPAQTWNYLSGLTRFRTMMRMSVPAGDSNVVGGGPLKT